MISSRRGAIILMNDDDDQWKAGGKANDTYIIH